METVFLGEAIGAELKNAERPSSLFFYFGYD